MKIVAINGSPRKKWNTAQALESALAGAKDAGAETKMFHLYDYLYKGCTSCFGCHLKSSMDNYHCFMKDELTPVLNECIDADAIIMGAPVYYSQLTGQFRSFMERLLFPIDTYYNDENGRVSKLKGHKPTAMILTMNMKPIHMENYFNHGEIFKKNANIIAELMHAPCHLQYIYDTLQFKNYDLYTNNLFDEEKKKERHETVFPGDLKKSYELGQQIAQEVIEYQNNK